MAVAKAINGNDTVNGSAAVCSGQKTALFDPTQRTQHFTQPDQLGVIVNIDSRYLHHGGAGGSGNWEH